MTLSTAALHQPHEHQHVGGMQCMATNEDFVMNRDLCGGKGNLVTHTPFYMKSDGAIYKRDVTV